MRLHFQLIIGKTMIENFHLYRCRRRRSRKYPEKIQWNSWEKIF